MSSFEALTLHRLILAVILTLLFILGYNILEVFLTPMAWAGVLAYVTWPAYQYLLRHCGQRANLAAALMTVALALLNYCAIIISDCDVKSRGKQRLSNNCRQNESPSIIIAEFYAKVAICK
jgi:predicted PurR-regulated permease PerM